MTQSINVTEAAALIKAGNAVLIDVREPDEFKDSHIAYAISVPLSVLEQGFAMLDIPADKTVLFQCLKGGRGQKACERIQGLEACQNKIVNIKGGLDAWKAQGLPVIALSKAQSKLSLMRQVQIIVGFLVALCVALGFAGIKIAFIFAGVFGVALGIAGLTGWCGLAILLSKMPWNK